jgi:hypothetical protein
LAEAAASQVATVTTALTAGAASVTAPDEKPVHPGKDDSHAAATQTTVPQAVDSTVQAPGVVALTAVEAGAVPAVMPNQTATATARLGAAPIPANPTGAVLAPDAASAHTAPPQNGQATSPQTIPAEPAAARNDRIIPSPVAMPAQEIPLPGTMPSPPASAGKDSDTKGRSPQEALPAPAASAPDAAATALVVSAYPAGTPTTAGEAGAADHRRAVAPKTSASLAANPSVGWDASSSPAHDLQAPGGQPATPTPYPGLPSQPVRPAVADAASPQAISVSTPPQTPLPAVPADTAGSASPTSAADHKITLRPAEAAADPAQPMATDGATLDQVGPTGTPPTVPTTTSVAAAHQAPVASPAEQVAPALLTLAKTADGSQQMTVRLQPAGLGMVQVRIAQAASGTTQIEITADNPATLLALQRDQPQLHHTLDDAGIPAAGRTITFHAAEVAQTTSSANASGTGHGDSQQSPAGRNSAGSTDADAGGGRGSYAAREQNTYPANRRPGPSPETAGATAATTARSYRIGLDITA